MLIQSFLTYVKSNVGRFFGTPGIFGISDSGKMIILPAFSEGHILKGSDGEIR